MDVSAALAHAHTQAQMQSQSLAQVQAQAQAQHAQHAARSAFAIEMHGGSGGGDLDSLLSGEPPAPSTAATAVPDEKLRQVLEPYESLRAHVLRAECYRRGIRPIKKGPLANDNKNGYILLLRKFDGTAGNLNLSSNGHGAANGNSNLVAIRDHDFAKRQGEEEEDGEGGDESCEEHLPSLAKKRKLSTSGAQQHLLQPQGHSTPTGGGNNLALGSMAGNTAADFGFYESAQPVLSMQYTPMCKPPNGLTMALATSTATTTTTDLEILSGIANTYTQNTATVGDAQLCGSCRTVVSDQLMESIRLGKNRVLLAENLTLMDQRDRDTLHLKEVLQILAELRTTYRDAQSDGLNHELLSELEDDIAFFLALKDRTKERMRLAMQERERTASKAPNSLSS